MKVIKKKGTAEEFKVEKIKGSLQKATIDAGYSVEEKKEILDQVFTNIKTKLEGKEQVGTDTIKGCLLTELDKCEPYIAKSVRRFDRKYKH
ncbi:MAG TPA: ATP cone domain-containing protein [Methanobacteriaceae archaeon]|nr:ATP cone domain-containing protein [Methanobacteriaceae archaeon]